MENKITKEFLAKFKSIKNVEDFIAAVKEEGVELASDIAEKLHIKLHAQQELTDDDVASVTGGCGDSLRLTCPKCGAGLDAEVKCPKCGDVLGPDSDSPIFNALPG